MKDISDLPRDHLREHIEQYIVPLGSPRDPGKSDLSWSDALSKAVVSSSQLAGLNLSPRAKLLGDWFCEGDLGFIYAFRGVGKTWLALAMARALSEGTAVGDWKAHQPTNVLYVDGEMPADLMRARDKGLGRGEGEIHFLNHEILFDRTQKVLNIVNIEVQQAITSYCLKNGIRVVIIDNLSTCASGMKENDSAEWEKVNNWLLQFRRHKIAVIMVHHAGRNGEARGTSKREDAAFWVIALDDAKGRTDDKRGARFISRFTKPSRNTIEEIAAYEWHVTTPPGGHQIEVTHKPAQSLDVFRQLIEDGVTDCDHIATEMKVSKATVSRMAKRAMDTGWLTKKGREYALIEGGDL
ncbi:MAG TPA: AAA family ATPase [Chthoniobacterales bacterium]|nr:AAA family ATPase [Chthoniobacterales bacterium]